MDRTPDSSRDKFTLTLEIPESDRFFDDKSDICEINGMETTKYYDLVPGQRPPDDMMAFLRLTVLAGVDAFHLEVNPSFVLQLRVWML